MCGEPRHSPGRCVRFVDFFQGVSSPLADCRVVNVPQHAKGHVLQFVGLVHDQQTSGVPQDRDHPLQLRTPRSSLTTPASGYRHLRLRFAVFFDFLVFLDLVGE